MKSRDDVNKLMDSIFSECQLTREQGQKEYAHKDSNALANFEDEGKDLNISREKVWAIFAGKHWRGIRAWINGHRSQREDIRGRIKDLIVYLVLLWAMVEDDEEVNRSSKFVGELQKSVENSCNKLIPGTNRLCMREVRHAGPCDSIT